MVGRLRVGRRLRVAVGVRVEMALLDLLGRGARDARVSRSSASDGPQPADVIARLASTGTTLGVAESLTGGMLMASLTSVPGSSAVLRGGVVAYASDVKVHVLGVDGQLIEAVGVVHPEVAAQMARGAGAADGRDPRRGHDRRGRTRFGQW